MIRKAVFGLAIIALCAIALVTWHRARYGDWPAPGLHTDVVLGNSDIGTNDTYYARVWNLSLRTIEIEGCRLPGGYVGSGTLYHWDVQRWDDSRHDWSSLQGANNWLPQPLGAWDSDNDYWSKCGGEITRIRPLGSRTVAWIFKDRVREGDNVRMAVHTSVKLPLYRQRIIYTQTFSIGK